MSAAANWAEHLDKISLGVGGLLFVVMIVLSLGGADEERIAAIASNIEIVTAQAEKVDENLPDEGLSGVTPSTAFRDQLSARFSPFSFPRWATHRRPLILRRVKARSPDVLCVHEPPSLDDPVVERGKIILSWTASDEDDNVNITEYKIFRGTNLSDPEEQLEDFEEVDSIDPGTAFELTWEDTTVEPDMSYTYYVVSSAVPDERAVASESGFIFDEEDYNKSTLISDTVVTPAETLIWVQDVELEFPGDGFDPERDTVEFRVARWDPAENGFGRGERLDPMTVGYPQDEPNYIGEGSLKTNWYVNRIGAEEVGRDAFGNPIWEFWAEIKHRFSGKTKKLVKGERPDEVD